MVHFVLTVLGVVVGLTLWTILMAMAAFSKAGVKWTTKKAWDYTEVMLEESKRRFAESEEETEEES